MAKQKFLSAKMKEQINHKSMRYNWHEFELTKLELEVVAENERAVEMYKRAGFIEYGRNPKAFRLRTGEYQELIDMRLELK